MKREAIIIMSYASIFSILFFSVFVISLVSGIFVLHNHAKAYANRVYFALIIAIGFWSIGLAFATSAPDASSCEIWRRFSAVGWGSAYSIILHFILIITGKIRLIKKWWRLVLLYGPAVITVLAFAVPGILNPSPYHLQLTQYGWINVAKIRNYNVWDWIFFVYYIGYILSGLALLFQWGRNATEFKIKKQSLALFLSLLSVFVLGSISDIILGNILGKAPQMAPVFLLIPIFTFIQTIKKYDFITSKPIEKKENYGTIIICVILYVFLFFLLSELAGKINGFEFIHITGIGTKGIITQFQLLISIILVIKEHKSGFIAAILLNSLSLFSSAAFAIIKQSTDSLPGIISYITTLLVIMLIAIFKKDTNTSIEEMQKQRQTLEVSEKKLFQMAYYDTLTGFHNRDWFVENLNQMIIAAKRFPSMIGVIFVDLDSFKTINDTMGHSIGDAVLKKISKRLSSCLREEDTLTRFGGDEFLMMVPHIENPQDLHKITDRIVKIFNQHIFVEDKEYFITASVGVAIYPIDGEDPETLIKNADIAMYSAKSKGKNQCVYCSTDIKNDTIRTLKLTNSLYRALDKNELFLVYQPQVSVTTQKIVGFEALLRWDNAEYGFIPPNVFIPMAEQTGLINPIGLWVFEKACKQLKKWIVDDGKSISLSINLSLEQLKDDLISVKIQKILNDTKTDPKNIQVEITESIAFNEDPFVLQRLKEIKDLGILIAIDDFGTGFSSFMRLKTFPIDILKIDIDFVRGISSGSQKDKSIIKGMINLAKNLDIIVLAEGVETKEQFDFLREHGCNMIQGYYFYKPMAAHDIEMMIKKES